MRGLFVHDLGASTCAPNKFKLYVDPTIVAGIIGAGASLAGAGISSTTSANLNKENRAYDKEKTEKMMGFNAEQAELARQGQSNLLSQTQAWDEYFYNQYNSPSAMRRQYAEAGYNPYLVEGQGVSGGSVPSVSSPSTAHASAPSTGNPPVVAPDLSALNHIGDYALQAIGVRANSANQQSEALANIADLIPKLHSLGYSDDEIKDVIQPFILSSQGINADSDLVFQTGRLKYQKQEIDNNFAALMYSIEHEFGRTERADKIMNLEQEFDRVAKEIGYYASLGELNDAKIDEIASIIKANIASAGLDSANTSIINSTFQHLVEQARYSAMLAKYSGLTSKGEYGLKEPIYDAVQSDVGRVVEQVDYYTDKVFNKIGKVGKVHIGLGSYKTENSSTINSSSSNRNWSINENYQFGTPRARAKRDGF